MSSSPLPSAPYIPEVVPQPQVFQPSPTPYVYTFHSNEKHTRKPSSYEQSPQVQRKKQQRLACVGGLTALLLTSVLFSGVVSGVVPLPESLSNPVEHVRAHPVATIARRGLRDMFPSHSKSHYSSWVTTSSDDIPSHTAPSHFTDTAADFYNEGEVGALIAGLSKELGRPVDSASLARRSLKFERERDTSSGSSSNGDWGRWYLMGKPTHSDPAPGDATGNFEKSFLYHGSEEVLVNVTPTTTEEVVPVTEDFISK